MMRLMVEGFQRENETSRAGLVMKECGTDLRLVLMLEPHDARRVEVEWQGKQNGDCGDPGHDCNCQDYSIFSLFSRVADKGELQSVILDRAATGGVWSSVRLGKKNGGALFRLRVPDAIALATRLGLPILGSEKLRRLMTEHFAAVAGDRLPDEASVKAWLENLKSGDLASD